MANIDVVDPDAYYAWGIQSRYHLYRTSKKEIPQEMMVLDEVRTWMPIYYGVIE